MTAIKFYPGAVVATPSAIAAFNRNRESFLYYLNRHLTGDWGALCEEDKQLNNQAVRDGSRILSAYQMVDGTKIWVITESDRSVTTFLLPEEY